MGGGGGGVRRAYSIILVCMSSGDKISTGPLVNLERMSNYSQSTHPVVSALGRITRGIHITYYSLMFFIVYAFKGQVHVFAGQVKILSHSSCRTSAIEKYFCPLVLFCMYVLSHTTNIFTRHLCHNDTFLVSISTTDAMILEVTREISPFSINP